MSTLMNEISTYVDEMFLKFVLGQVSLDTYPQYVSQLKKLGIDDVLKIQQAALERYRNR